MTKILVIDDVRSFKKEVIKAHPDWKVTYTRNEFEALDIIKDNTKRFDEIYFDHDLGLDPTDFGNPNVITTMPIALYLEKLAYNNQPYLNNSNELVKIYIQSVNPISQNKLKMVLKKYKPKMIKADTYFFVTKTLY